MAGSGSSPPIKADPQVTPGQGEITVIVFGRPQEDYTITITKEGSGRAPTEKTGKVDEGGSKTESINLDAGTYDVKVSLPEKTTDFPHQEVN